MDRIDLLVISGASRGIGRAVLENLSDKVNKTIAIGSSDEILRAAEMFSNCISIKADICNYDLVSNCLDDCEVDCSPRAIAIVLCAASIGEFGGIISGEIKEWSTLYSTNVLGNLNIIQYLVKKYRLAKFRIVFFAGGGAAYAYPEFFGYSLTKVSVVGQSNFVWRGYKDTY